MLVSMEMTNHLMIVTFKAPTLIFLLLSNDF